MDKGAGYERFKSRWRFGWENESVPEFKPLTEEEAQTIMKNHQKIWDNRKKK